MLAKINHKEVISITEHGMSLLLESMRKSDKGMFPPEVLIGEFLDEIAKAGLLRIKLFRESERGDSQIYTAEKYDESGIYMPPWDDDIDFLLDGAALVAFTDRDIVRHEHPWVQTGKGE